MRSDRIGHTAVTWPFTPAGAEQAMADVGSLGYAGIELFGFVLDAYPGGVGAVRADLERSQLKLAAAYCSATLTDPAKASSDVESMLRWASMVRDLGGSAIVVGASVKKKADYVLDDYDCLCTTVNEIGRRSLEIGVKACFHPHTGTPVETMEEIDRVMGGVDPATVFMAPDTGQIAKGGSDPVDVVRRYKDRIRHVHLKDWIGGKAPAAANGTPIDRTGYLDYVPLGQGVVDLAAIVHTLEAADFDGWWMVELDGTDQIPQPPRQAAAISKRYVMKLASANGVT